jgi:hypothetical protein
MRGVRTWTAAAIATLAGVVIAQNRTQSDATGELRVRLESSLPGRQHAVPAALWLEPRSGVTAPPFPSDGRYILMQKDRTFTPHLQVVPVGGVVQFPNQDPFFHNVFSLFDGKRFDLGLYEAGSSKSVTFSRPGVSYIFCNIHPEMSAIVIALDTSLYAIADSHDSFVLRRITPGDYTLHLWIEGVPQTELDHLSKTLRVPSHGVDLGVIEAPFVAAAGMKHDNMYGHPYASETQPTY